VKRLFIRIGIPDKVKGKIHEQLVKPLEEMKSVNTKNLHITVAFIGNTDEDKINEIIENLSNVKFFEFEIVLEGVGTFDKRVIWLGAKSKELEDLTEQISSVLGLEGEFFGHVTLARANGSDFETEFDKIKESSLKEIIKVNTLMSSELFSDGPKHSVIKIFSAQQAQ